MVNIKFKSVAHLYLGCDYLISTQGENPVIKTSRSLPFLFGSLHVEFGDNTAYEFENIKPMLYSLGSMVDEQCLKVADILGGASYLIDESKIIQVVELMNGIYNKQTNIPGKKWMDLTVYLLGEYFDLFELIKNDEAISATENKK